MIPLKEEAAEGTLAQQFETRDYEMIKSPKGFAVLSDTLYQDKIQSPMREYMTNAYDSHRDAGVTVPFDVTLPTPLSPFFKVRDYGTGLSHEDVYNVFTTAFASKKEGTNEQVGYLGLGSKSAFAYTGAFNIRVWFDGEERCYIANKNPGSVPQVSLTSTRPSDEPTGLEISYAVKNGDASAFLNAAKNLAFGYSDEQIKPKFNLEIEEWLPESAIYYRTDEVIVAQNLNRHGYSYGRKAFIKQGCVLYPVDLDSVLSYAQQRGILNRLTNNICIIITVPIGTVGVAASRETLSLDEATQDNVREIITKVINRLHSDIDAEVSAAKTLVEASKVVAKFANFYTMSNITWNGVSISHYEISKQFTELSMSQGAGKQKTQHLRFKPSQLEDYQFLVVEKDEKVTRVKDRWNQWIEDNDLSEGYNSPAVFLSNVTEDEFKDFKKFFEFKDSQFTYARDVIPPTVNKTVKSADGTKNITVTRLPYKLTKFVTGYRNKPSIIWEQGLPDGDYYWVEATKKGGDIKFAERFHGTAAIREHILPACDALQQLGMTELPVYAMLPSVVKKMNPPEDKRLDTAMIAYVEDNEDHLINTFMRNYSGLMNETQLTAFGISAIALHYSKWQQVSWFLARVNKFESLLNQAKNKRKQFKRDYPLIFDQTIETYTEYIQVMDNTRKAQR